MAKLSASGFIDTEIGSLPCEWTVGPLGNYLMCSQYGISMRGQQVGQYPILRMNNLQGGTIDTGSLQFVDLKDADFEKFRLKNGDILFNRTNSFELVGKTSLFELSDDFVFASYLIRLTCAEDRLDPAFVNLYMNSTNAQQRLKLLATRGVSQSNINATKLKGLPVAVPPLEEQQAIAGVLRTVQRAKRATEKVITAARQLKQSLMRHLFTYGAAPFQEAGQIEVQETDIGELPTGWETTTIGDVAHLTQYGISKRGESTGAYPILRMNNLTGGRVDFSSLQYVDLDDDEFAKFEVHQGDILFNRTNSFELVGKTSLFESDTSCVFASYLIRVTLDDHQVEPAFVNYYMNDDSTQRRLKTLAARAVSQSNINATKLKGFVIPRPERATQSVIADQINSLDEKIRREEKRRAAIEEVFNSLLHELMTGQRRVHEVDEEVL